MFINLLEKIDEASASDFIIATDIVSSYIDTADNFLDIVREIGVIPESIPHDSTQEKLYSKASDAVLARAFRELGLNSTVLSERGDSADVQAQSPIYGYTLVADAKAFRMSRTAKNQKDFKVVALSGWRRDADYAVLCSPYFQYPTAQSQIYAQSLDYNVCLLGWEHIIYLLEHNIKETETTNLSTLWSISADHANTCVIANKKRCFVDILNQRVNSLVSAPVSFMESLQRQFEMIQQRSLQEISYWEHELLTVQNLSLEEAISELIKYRKIDEKIAQIRKYVLSVQHVLGE